MKLNSEKYRLSDEMGKVFEWRKWAEKIPYIAFPPGYKIQIMPPLNAAIVRFRVSMPGIEESISVYLDCYDLLGAFGEPYWEVSNYRGGYGRCKMQDTQRLLEMIADRSSGED